MKLFKLLFLIIILVGVFFFGYYAAVHGWMPAITKWFEGMGK